MRTVGLNWRNITWCFLTHGMIKRLRVFSLTLIEILLPSSPGHQFIHNEVRRISKYYLSTLTRFLIKGRPTWWHLLYYVNLLLNVFRMLIHPSSGACDYLMRYCVGCMVLTWGVLVLCSGIGCVDSLHNNAPRSRKLLKMDVLTSETCWAVNWHNKASVIKLVYLCSNIKMMHGPIRIRLTRC